MRLTSWHVMKDTDWRTHGWQVWQTAGTISCVTFTLLNAACSFTLSFVPFCLSLPSSDLPMYSHNTTPTHSLSLTSLPLRLCIHTHTNTEMDQFHIPFQDAEDAMSHCQFMAWCLIPPNAAMQISLLLFFFCVPTFFFLYGFILLRTIISPPQMLHLVTYFWKWGRSFFVVFLAGYRQNNNKVN